MANFITTTTLKEFKKNPKRMLEIAKREDVYIMEGLQAVLIISYKEKKYTFKELDTNTFSWVYRPISYINKKYRI